MNGNIPRMDYRQYRAARRLVHECCNYDSGNCLLVEDGEPCVCVQSISYSLLCRWFTAAVLPLDEALETKLQGKKELQRQVLAYAKTKPARDGLKAQKSEKARAAYRQANESDFIIADAAARYFKAHGITKLPARKALQAEIEQLISEKDGLYNTYHEQKQRFKELQTVKRNIDQILRREEPHRRKEQSHER